MKPLNYAILKYMTTVPEASVDDVIAALRPEYGSFKALNKGEVLTSLMTAKANGLLEESRFDADSAGGVRVFFRAHQQGTETINNYIK